MRKICLLIVLLLCICCCKTTQKNSNECVDYNNEYVNKPHIGNPSDVVIIRDSFHLSYDFSTEEKEFLVSKNYIGARYVCNQDTVVEEPYAGLLPNVMKEIHSYGKEVIPYLINHIDMDKYGIAGFFNPYDSNIGNKVIGSPMGVNYAYMIELILAKDSIIDNISFAEGFSIWQEKMKPYHAYGQCVIIRKKDMDNPQNSKITLDDMKTIKAIYNDWWKNNKDESLVNLRKKWRKEGSPLQNSPFMWI